MKLLRSSEAPVEKVEDCAFYEVGYCILNNRSCNIVSHNAIRRYPGFETRDYIELHWRQKQRVIDMRFRWAAVLMSLLALIISIASFINSIDSPEALTPELQETVVGDEHLGTTSKPSTTDSSQTEALD